MTVDTQAVPPGGRNDLVEAAGVPVGSGVVKPGYDPRLTNEDLAPLGKQTWGSYNIFAFWMSDVHSVGGYVTDGHASSRSGLNALAGLHLPDRRHLHRAVLLQPRRQAEPAGRGSLPGDQSRVVRCPRRQHPGDHPRPDRGGLVRRADLPGRRIAEHRLPEAVAKPRPVGRCQRTRVPGPVGSRLPELRDPVGPAGGCCSGAAWTSSASSSTSPALLSTSSWSSCASTCSTRFTGSVNLNLSKVQLTGSSAHRGHVRGGRRGGRRTSPARCSTSVTSPATPSDFKSIKKGNFLGLPLNFIMFSPLTVLTAAATVPLYGELITDPIKTVQKIDSTFAIMLGGCHLRDRRRSVSTSSPTSSARRSTSQMSAHRRSAGEWAE